MIKSESMLPAYFFLGMSLRLMLSVACLLTLWLTFGAQWMQKCLPFLGWVFELVASDFELLGLSLNQGEADQVLRATVVWKHTMVIGEHVIYTHPQGRAYASTLAAHFFAGPMVAFCCASVWPISQSWPVTSVWKSLSRNAAHLMARWGVVALLCVGLIAVDLPVVLAGEIWQMVVDQLSPGDFSMLEFWRRFMQAGGRYALGVSAGATAVTAVQLVATRIESRIHTQ